VALPAAAVGVLVPEAGVAWLEAVIPLPYAGS